VATSVAVGAITISPVTLAFLETSRRGSGSGLALRNFALPLLHSIKRPIVWAPLLGLVFSCLGVHLPSFLQRSVAVMGSAADGSALVLTGLVVSAQKFEFTGSALIAALLKDGLQPAFALGCAMLMHLPTEQMREVVLISAIPCGFFGVVFGKQADSNPKLASSALIVSYEIGVATLAAWIVILKHLG
jgi:malonate transporter